MPARGGSKGISRKNLRPLKGKPLLAYTADAVLAARSLSRAVVSTDDDEIARVAENLGLDVPFKRPPELASDDARTLPVVQHALSFIERDEGRPYEIVVLIQPTCPLRTGADIDRCVELLTNTGADSVVSVVSVGAHHPYRMKQIDSDGKLVNLIDQGFEDMRPRQELPPVYIRNGALYVSRRHIVVDQNTLVSEGCIPYVMPEERSVNIDTPADLAVAEYQLDAIGKT